jgi:hypothetical protein
MSDTDMVVVVWSDVNLDPMVGDPSVITGMADGLKRPTAKETLDAIHQYLADNLKMVEPATWDHPSRGRKTSVEILREGAWGCSAHAQVACHLARACGIPAILVKSLNLEWINRKNRGDGHGEGHVYVEVLREGRPALWDAQGGRLFDKYDPNAAVTPDGLRRIYEKGGPDRLVLSHHGKEWEEETGRLFPKAG